jgi:hypothetical protein
MTRLIMPFLVGLLLALGGTTGAAIVKAKNAPVPARTMPGSLAADSTHATTAEGTPHAAPAADSTAPTVDTIGGHAATRRPPARVPAAVPATAAAEPHVPAPAARPVAPAKEVAQRVQAAKTPADAALPERRLAKIFGAMPAREAARVLEQMDDKDVQTILDMLGDRQAAAILSSFTPQRAASIGKGSLRTARSRS